MHLEYLKTLCKGDTNATRLIEDVWNVATVWDDAVDGDKRQDIERINRAFEWAMFGMRSNPMLLQHPELLLTLKVCALNWKCANELQKRGTADALATAYALRCSPYDFFVAVVLLAAGPDAAQEAVNYLRGAPDLDSFASYCREHLKV